MRYVHNRFAKDRSFRGRGTDRDGDTRGARLGADRRQTCDYTLLAGSNSGPGHEHRPKTGYHARPRQPNQANTVVELVYKRQRLADGAFACGGGFAIPDGARIIIELISAKMITPPTSDHEYVAIVINKNGIAGIGVNEESTAAVYIPLQVSGVHDQLYHHVAVQPVHLQITKDDWLCEAPYVGPSFVDGTMHISYFGYITKP